MFMTAEFGDGDGKDYPSAIEELQHLLAEGRDRVEVEGTIFTLQGLGQLTRKTATFFLGRFKHTVDEDDADLED